MTLTLEDIKWILGGLGAFALMILAGMGALLKMAHFVGRSAERIEGRVDTVARDIVGVKAHADEVPRIKLRVEQVEHAWSRTQDDLRTLRHKTGNPSCPDFSNGADD